ncbi:LysM peptidoglycan-binding domain-containing protein [Ornithinimicrobium sp. F0845]|uniref:LysM peptidoglycan-binding domain-containing protein n=1 Tax=Ornithinimicrobium sp. F0845 TaxID=2926412 RepID=UPI001FF34CE8|nr:LysM domain-containing protein [Ornithinimicrobium sp. F0845]MCK0111391.1 LysM peptidoglycan-binding domain-containing protein [Ornithinimicrobium sp. F0845]
MSEAAVGLGAAVLGVAAAATLSVLALACGRHLRRQWETGLLDDPLVVSHGLETIAVAGAGLVAGWLAALLLVGAVASLPGRSTAPLRSGAAHLAPRLAPRVSAVLIAVAATALPVGSAHAQPSDSSHGPRVEFGHVQPSDPSHGQTVGSGQPGGAPAPAPDPAPRAPEPGWRPTTPPASPDPSAITLVSRGGAQPDSVVVRAGDTLWDIAARHLGDDADAGAVAAAWPRWYAANRATIGDDPDHILPGTHLVPPDPAEVTP